MCNNAIVIELDELIDHDNSTSHIAVDKSIFDDFVKNTIIDIRFADSDYPLLTYTYIMVAEDDKAIYMELTEN